MRQIVEGTQYARPESVIVAEDVWKGYSAGPTRTSVLCGVNLAVRRGECVFLAGPSGSGKTTLLSILGCILSHDRGRVRVLDCDLGEMDAPARSRFRRDRIGFVFQRFHLIRGLTALDNVCVPLVLKGAARAAARRHGRELLASVGLADRAEFQPRNLSAGQCQRVAFARALANDPDLILADEPTASLDAAAGQDVMQLLRRLAADRNKTVIVVTHDQRIFHFADRVCLLENGGVVQHEGQGP